MIILRYRPPLQILIAAAVLIQIVARQPGSFEPGIRSQALERHANDRKPAFAAEPGIGKCRGRLAIGGGGQSRGHDRARPPRSHNFDGVQTVALKQYIEDLCRDMSAMLSFERSPEQIIAVEGIEINLPTATGIPLGFIVNELITNAVKYGNGRITVRLEGNPEAGYALSVSNDGAPLPEGFDPAVRKGLGMTIVRALVERIDGKLRIGRADKSQGTQFTVCSRDRAKQNGAPRREK